MGRKAGFALVVPAILAALFAPFLAPHAVDEHFSGMLSAPPTIPHIVDDSGRTRGPFIYPWRLVNQLEQIYEQDRSAPVPLAWSGRATKPGRRSCCSARTASAATSSAASCSARGRR